MAKLDGTQSIPAELLELYQATLTEKQPDDVARKRYPFRVPRMQDDGKNPTAAQRAHRTIFKKCVACYNNQPYEHGETPPDIGPRNRSWWFDEADGSGLWYYDYFMQQTLDVYIAGNVPDWCKEICERDTYTSESNPTTHYNTSEIVVMAETPGAEMWGYVRKDDPRYKTLHLYIIGNAGGPGKDVPYWLDFYIQETYWNGAVLDWDNQPAPGALIYTLDMLGEFEGWVEIPCGDWFSVVCKTRLATGAIVWWASRENADTSKRPFWTFD